MLCVCHTTPTQKLLCLHVFRQAGLGPKVGFSIKCLSQGHSDALLHRESKQGLATFRLQARRLYHRRHAAALIFLI